MCVYDRAGRGWSDPADGPQDAARIAADLHTLLERAQVPGPYVLAGHSFGGLYVQTFAATYPDQVAGLVLLDSTAPKPGPALPTRTESYDVLGRVSAVFSAVAHLGAGRLIAQASYDTLPPHFRGEARANASTAPYLASWIEEFVAANTSMQQAAALTNLDGKPLVVVTADTGNAAGWEQKQDQMAALSTNSSHRVAKDTTHESLLHDETDSAQASQAIHDVLRSVRTGSPYRSDDDGKSWSKAEYGMGRAYAIPIAIHRDAPDRIFLGAAENGPTSWLGHRTVRAGPYNTIKFSPDTSEKLGGAKTGILRSDDAGETWRRLNNGLPQSYPHMTCGFALHPQDGNTVCVSYTDGSIYASNDAGDSWRKLDVNVSKLYGIRLMAGN